MGIGSLLFKEVNRGKVKGYGRIKDANGRLALGEDEECGRIILRLFVI